MWFCKPTWLPNQRMPLTNTLLNAFSLSFAFLFSLLAVRRCFFSLTELLSFILNSISFKSCWEFVTLLVITLSSLMNRFQIDDFGKTSVLQKAKANENDDLFLLDIHFFTLADLWTLLLGTIAFLPGEPKGAVRSNAFQHSRNHFDGK